MRKRLLAVTAATMLAVGMSAGSALAHFNEAAGKSVGVPAHATPSGLGHVGMECGARNDTRSRRSTWPVRPGKFQRPLTGSGAAACVDDGGPGFGQVIMGSRAERPLGSEPPS
jgi:hypothetical protein